MGGAATIGSDVRRKRKAKLVHMLGGKCFRCPENRLACLTLHHRDPDTRRLPNSRTSHKTLWSFALTEEILAEARQCDLLCANCHMLEHAHEDGCLTAEQVLAK